MDQARYPNLGPLLLRYPKVTEATQAELPNDVVLHHFSISTCRPDNFAQARIREISPREAPAVMAAGTGKRRGFRSPE